MAEVEPGEIAGLGGLAMRRVLEVLGQAGADGVQG